MAFPISILATGNHSAVLVNNSLFMWGDNEFGQLCNGVPSKVSAKSPIRSSFFAYSDVRSVWVTSTATVVLAVSPVTGPRSSTAAGPPPVGGSSRPGAVTSTEGASSTPAGLTHTHKVYIAGKIGDVLFPSPAVLPWLSDVTILSVGTSGGADHAVFFTADAAGQLRAYCFGSSKDGQFGFLPQTCLSVASISAAPALPMSSPAATVGMTCPSPGASRLSTTSAAASTIASPPPNQRSTLSVSRTVAASTHSPWPDAAHSTPAWEPVEFGGPFWASLRTLPNPSLPYISAPPRGGRSENSAAAEVDFALDVGQVTATLPLFGDRPVDPNAADSVFNPFRIVTALSLGHASRTIDGVVLSNITLHAKVGRETRGGAGTSTQLPDSSFPIAVVLFASAGSSDAKVKPVASATLTIPRSAVYTTGSPVRLACSEFFGGLEAAEALISLFSAGDLHASNGQDFSGDATSRRNGPASSKDATPQRPIEKATAAAPTPLPRVEGVSCVGIYAEPDVLRSFTLEVCSALPPANATSGDEKTSKPTPKAKPKPQPKPKGGKGKKGKQNAEAAAAAEAAAEAAAAAAAAEEEKRLATERAATSAAAALAAKKKAYQCIFAVGGIVTAVAVQPEGLGRSDVYVCGGKQWGCEPKPLVGMNGIDVRAISVSNSSIAMLSGDQDVYIAGAVPGRSRRGTSGVQKVLFSPQSLPAPITAISISETHLLMLSDGSIYAGGSNSFGQLGCRSTSPGKPSVRSSPVQARSTAPFTASGVIVAVPAPGTKILAADSPVSQEASRLVADLQLFPSLSPNRRMLPGVSQDPTVSELVRVPNLPQGSVVAISANYGRSSCVTRNYSDTTVYAWGDAFGGYLGIRQGNSRLSTNSKATASVPAPVALVLDDNVEAHVVVLENLPALPV